ncbi:hypothetical protein B0J17DRAFT_771516 [Rhizoctonia solani]|nr:hypothetical protein B0J17DRAFT_771516 [Rhizoctonia solani]
MQWGQRFEVGLAGIPRYMTLDENQRLIFVADNDRIKSFEWASSNGSYHKRPLAIHTLSSKQINGPIATLPNGALIRAGAGTAAVWALSQLKTHRLKGDQTIGKDIFIDDECEYDSDCDDVPHLEYSSGSPRTLGVAFANDPKLKPNVWRVLPHSPSTVLATGRMERNCVTIDLEHGGKTIARYQDHSGFVSTVCASMADPRAFLTSCRDGKECGAIALAYPDGILTVFTASQYGEDFKVRDIRSRTCVYELGVEGYHDSSVCSFEWDSGRNSSYSLRSVFEDGGGYSDDSDDDGEGSCYSRIYRYSFKDKPRYAMLPTDNPKLDEQEYFEDEYDTDAPMDDSDEDYVD